ncbi:MAG TPA: hypothetical protein VM925_18195, partial [Labilithrix sp.]|nr:hypothetical protein [Labilithrix sp.]
MSDARASDADTVAFLQWAAPRLGLRWEGFRRVRGTVRKRLKRRLGALGLADLSEYRARLEVDPNEWALVEEMCRMPISRFHRDRAVFDMLAHEILPALAARATSERRSSVRVW